MFVKPWTNKLSPISFIYFPSLCRYFILSPPPCPNKLEQDEYFFFPFLSLSLSLALTPPISSTFFDSQLKKKKQKWNKQTNKQAGRRRGRRKGRTQTAECKVRGGRRRRRRGKRRKRYKVLAEENEREKGKMKKLRYLSKDYIWCSCNWSLCLLPAHLASFVHLCPLILRHAFLPTHWHQRGFISSFLPSFSPLRRFFCCILLLHMCEGARESPKCTKFWWKWKRYRSSEQPSVKQIHAHISRTKIFFYASIWM